MAFIVDENGEITMVQGDSGELVVTGLPTDKNYKVYFAIQDKDRNPVGDELSIDSNQSSSVVFALTGNLTDLLEVDKKSKNAKYYYGVKVCSSTDSTEDTVILGNGEIGSLNSITVYPRKVKGI